MLLGTPGFIAPEQLPSASRTPGSASTLVDVYSLGAILYLLLVGRLPSDDATPRGRGEPIPSRRFRALLEREPELAQRIAEQRGTTPPQLLGTLIGDLDWIVMKAMEPDPRRRFASAEALDRDLYCYRHLLPVAARPPSRADRLRKFVRRNLVSVLVTAVLLLAGVAVTTLSILGWSQATENTRLAREKTEEAGAAALGRHRAAVCRRRGRRDARRLRAGARGLRRGQDPKTPQTAAGWRSCASSRSMVRGATARQRRY